MQYSDNNNSPYTTLANGVGGGLGRQQSLTRQQSLRASTGTLPNTGRNIIEAYTQQQSGGRPGSSKGTGAYGGRISASGAAALYSSSSGGVSVLPGASRGSASPRGAPPAGAVTASGAVSLPPLHPHPEAGTTQRPNTSGSWGAAKGPLSQRLAQVKAVYTVAKMNRSMDSFRGGGGGIPSPRSPANAPARRDGQRPVGFTCYLCGQQYGSQSLMVHIPQCQKKWVMVESQKPRREQRPLPPPPPEMERGVLPTRPEEVEEFNSRMYSYWDKVSLVSCPICARTFRPDAFERHAKVCTPDNPGGPLGPNKHAPARPTGTGGGMGTGARPPSAARGGGGAGGGGIALGGSGRAASPSRAPARRDGQRPVGFTCYLCGQQYGSQSLMVHIPQCQKKWVMVESQKPRREQRPLPPSPPEMERGVLPTRPEEIEEFNSCMYSYWDKVSLVSCPICARTFRPDAFERHAKVCTPDNPGGPLGPNKHAPARPTGAGGGMGTGARPPSAARGGGGGGGGGGSAPARREGERPRAYVCYLCGQQFGSQSLTIHIPQCYEKWLKVEATKAPKERRPPPPPPPELDQPLPTRVNEVDEFNAKMFGYYNGVSLMPCPHCGRTMRPEALAHHMKACTADKPMARPGAGAGGGGGGGAGAARAAGGGAAAGPSEYDESDPAELEQCANCGRRIRPDALVKHQRMCTADKPMKPLRAAGGGGGGMAGGGARGAAGGGPPTPPAARAGAARSSMAGGGARGGGGGADQAEYGDESNANGEEGDGAPEPPKVSYDLPPDAGGYDDGGEERVQCGTCGRRFLPEALEKHSRVCAKVFAGKRKVFNSAAKRVAGTEAASYFNPRSAARPSPPSGPAPTGGRPRGGTVGGRSGGGYGGGNAGGGGAPKWKAQSEALRQAMRDMRKVGAALARGEDLRNIPHVPSAPDPSLVQCPTCGRRFNAQAAERHISRCATIVNKPKFLKAGTGGAGKGAPDSKPLPRW